MKDKESRKEEMEQMALKSETDFIKEAINIKCANVLLLEELKVENEEKSILEERLE